MKTKRPRRVFEGRPAASSMCSSACGVVVFALAAVLPGSPAVRAEAPDTVKKIEGIERAVEGQRNRAQALAREAEMIAGQTADLSRTLVELAREARSLERRTAELRAQVANIDEERRQKQLALERQHARLIQFLGALQRIARNPPEAVLAYSASPQDTLRSALLLKSVLPQLEARAHALRSKLKALGNLREDAAHRAAAVAATASSLTAKRDKIDRLIAQKRRLARSTRAEQRRAEAAGAQLAAEAKSLRGLLRRIEKDRKLRRAKPRHRPPPASRPRSGAAKNTEGRPADTEKLLAFRSIPSIGAARGRLVTPVVGRLVTRFGKKRGIGTRAKGLSFVTAAGARVVAPHGGHVVFAGPFRGYGRLLIIDHGEGYHTLLAGLGRIDVTVDQWLLSGEPIGIMAPPGKVKPRLYMELRHDGHPVDPLPWLAATPTDKVSG